MAKRWHRLQRVTRGTLWKVFSYFFKPELDPVDAVLKEEVVGFGTAGGCEVARAGFELEFDVAVLEDEFDSVAIDGDEANIFWIEWELHLTKGRIAQVFPYASGGEKIIF